MPEPEWADQIPDWVPREVSDFVIGLLKQAPEGLGQTYRIQAIQTMGQILTDKRMETVWKEVSNYADTQTVTLWFILVLNTVIAEKMTVTEAHLENRWKSIVEYPKHLADMAENLRDCLPFVAMDLIQKSFEIENLISGGFEKFSKSVTSDNLITKYARFEPKAKAFIRIINQTNREYLRSPRPDFTAILANIVFQRVDITSEIVRTVVRS